jgi:predicted aspartyl protease
MQQSLQLSTILMLSGVALITASCSGNPISSLNAGSRQTASVQVTPVKPKAIATPTPRTPARPDPYPLALSRASSAVNISRSAQSQDDWRLVASRWQQAIALIRAIPATSPRHAEAQSKLAEYGRNLAFAQQQANRSTVNPNPGGVIVINPYGSSQSQNSQIAEPIATAAPTSGGGRVFEVPIIRRAGGTPVVNVTFNGNQQYAMILDTGASGTLITPQMAAALNVVPVAQATVDTASARNVAFPLGYVRSVQVGNAVAQNLLVAVSGPDLSIGLLGHDFFGNYDVTIRQSSVEFRER